MNCYSFIFQMMGILLLSMQLNAAPIPATTSSLVINSERKVFFSPLGFKLEAGNTHWEHSQIHDKTSSITTLYQEPYKPEKEHRALLTVRTDSLKKSTSLFQYVKKWLHEYPYYGFNVLKTKKINLKGTQGFLIEVTNNAKNKKKIRQIVFLKKKLAVILSCIDSQETFKLSLKSCNKIIRSFKWTKNNTLH